jgi:NAD(P)-dependent dehydrogenase (short-subunit alcohol dehydrogenase family)
MRSKWSADDIPDQSGRTVLVTGANSGLGLETAKALARRGAHVIMAVRDIAKGRAAAAAIADDHPGADLEVRRLDLADLESVSAFADDLTGRLDGLVNNAGIMVPPRSLSPQGHESQFAVNHLGHFALTGLLLDRIERGRDPRVVTVSSMAHALGRIHFDDLTGERRYSPSRYYGQSKLANILFGLELHRRLRAGGSAVRSVMAHPGAAATSLIRTRNPLHRFLEKVAVPVIGQSAAAGALPQLYAATDPRAESGQYIGPDGRGEMKGHPTVVPTRRPSTDEGLAARLWTLSEELTGVRFPLPTAA